MDGVHCRWVTPWRSTSAARESSRSLVEPLPAGTEPATVGWTASLRRARAGSEESTTSAGRPNSIRQPTSSTPIAFSWSMRSTHDSGVPNRPLESK